MTPQPDCIDIATLSDPVVEDQVCQVVAYLKTLEDPNIIAVAGLCGAPYSRVYHRFDGRLSRYDRDGPTKHLSTSEEGSLCTFFSILDEIELSPKLSLVARSANELLPEGHPGNCDSPTVSDMWPFRFCEWYPELFIIKQKAIDINRKQAYDVDNINDWFCRFLAVCKLYNIDPRDIWNVDETGFNVRMIKN
jgi:hypothetical protein